ncbi:MAG: 4-hydroxy-tetrahydrodipicolinate reductase [Oscillospiraceae bacterium]|nr:4-hydroxy-tetrahydrodipicolinate reductase [Oscillospiraceae bacterium]
MKKKRQILLNGASGKMGRVVADCAGNGDECEIIAGVDLSAKPYAAFPVYKSIFEFAKTADVLIDFSHPRSLGDILSFAVKKNIPAVIATTGYNEDEINEIRRISKQAPIFFSANMSLGINLLTALSRKAAAVLGDTFDIEILEKHHNQKIDAPSGTALALADAINSELSVTCEYVYDRHGIRQKRGKREIGLHSVRGGTITGEHEIIFAGRDEVVSLTHKADSKEVFAAGALKAALFMCGKEPGLYDMNDLISG